MKDLLGWKFYIDGKNYAHATSDIWEGSAPLVFCEIHEELFFPYKIEAVIALDQELVKEDLGSIVSVNLGSSEKPFRIFIGNLFKFQYTGTVGKLTSPKDTSIQQFLYKIEIFHCMEKLAYEKKLRIFQDSTRKEIISTILEEADLVSTSYLSDSDNVCSTNTQYNESTLNYMARLIQEEGYIAYLNSSLYCAEDVDVGVEPIIDQPDYVLTENIDSCAKFTLKFTSSKVGSYELDKIIDFKYSDQAMSESYSLYGYNFITPSEPVYGKYENLAWMESAQHHYPTRVDNLIKATEKAEQTYKRKNINSSKFEAKTTCYKFSPGTILVLDSEDSLAGEYFIEKVFHTIEKTENGWEYRNIISGVASDPDYSPAKTLKKPLVHDTQTAFVASGDDDEINVDEFGRIKVKFMWVKDTEDSDGEDDVYKTKQPSAWARVMQWGSAGSSWGNVSMPRVGQEVVVGFLNGDSDSPIILGAVFNTSTNFPSSMPDEADSLIMRTRTRGLVGDDGESYNEISMSNVPDEQLVYIRAQNNMTRLILNDSTDEIFHNDTKIVKNDMILNISEGNKYESLGCLIQKPSEIDEFALIGAAFLDDQISMNTISKGVHFMHVGEGAIGLVVTIGDLTLALKKGLMNFESDYFVQLVRATSYTRIFGSHRFNVMGSSTTSIGGASNFSVSGDHNLSVKGLFETSVKGLYKTSVDGVYSVNAVGDLNLSGLAVNLSAEGEMSIEATAALSLKAAEISIDAAAINITGAEISLTGEAALKLSASAIVTVSAALIELG